MVHSLSPDEKHKIYSLYKTIFDFDLSDPQSKYAGFMKVAKPNRGWSWRVVGITKAALESLALSDYKDAKGIVCRAHKVGRAHTAEKIFGTDLQIPLTEDQLFEIVWDNDETVITTKSENKLVVPKYIPIDYEQGMFKGKRISWTHGKTEADFLRRLHLDHKKEPPI